MTHTYMAYIVIRKLLGTRNSPKGISFGHWFDLNDLVERDLYKSLGQQKPIGLTCEVRKFRYLPQLGRKWDYTTVA